MFIGKALILAGTTLLALALSGSAGFAAATVDSADCALFGKVDVGGRLETATWTSSVGGVNQSGNPAAGAFGDLAVGESCGMFNFQVDSALKYMTQSGMYTASAPNYFRTEGRTIGHVGGAAFIRDINNGAVGLSGSYIITATSDTYSTPPNASGSEGMFRVGSFAESYLGDSVTIGASAHYFNGKYSTACCSPNYIYNQGGEFGVSAKFYPNDNFSLGIRADGLLSNQIYFDGGSSIATNGLALTGRAEYKLSDSNLSMFIDGTWATRTAYFTGGENNVSGVVGSVGLAYYFGGSSGSSLKALDRSGTYDNASMFNEKLTDFINDRLSTYYH